MSTSSATPAPTGNRYTVVSSDDHSGIIWIVSILCAVYSLMVVVLRTVAKFQDFGWDDWLSTAATIFAIAQYITVFAATSHGLGRSFSAVSVSDASIVGKTLLTGQILLLLALCLAKLSITFLCRRLFGRGMPNRLILCDITAGICVLWGIGSILGVAIGCSSLEVIGFQRPFCPNLALRWKAIGILDCLTEIPIVLISVAVVWPLQMSRTRRIHALTSFFLRLIIIVFAILHITSLSSATYSHNRGVALALPTMYLQVELFYSLLSCAVPALNRWLRNFDTSMGTTWTNATSQHYGSTQDSNNGAPQQNYRLEPLKPSYHHYTTDDEPGLRSNKTVQSSGTKGFIPSGNNHYTASCERENHADGRSSHSREEILDASMHSEDMIIRKDVGWQVTYEDHNGEVIGRGAG